MRKIGHSHTVEQTFFCGYQAICFEIVSKMCSQSVWECGCVCVYTQDVFSRVCFAVVTCVPKAKLSKSI